MEITQKTDEMLLKICWFAVFAGIIFCAVLFKIYW